MSALGGWSGAGGWGGWSGSGGWGGWSGSGGWGGWNGAGQLGGWSAGPTPESPLLSGALVQSRGALVGPFQGPVFKIPNPPLDEPRRLAGWEVGPRMQICELELLSGIQFTVDKASDSVTVGYVDVNKPQSKPATVARLQRPSADIFEQQSWLVANYAELRADRGSEVLVQTVPQVPFWASVVGLTAHRHKYTIELAGLMLSLASHVEMRFKHEFACARPVERSPQIQPMIPTPGHASWPSGHGTEAFAVAALLQALLPQGASYREQLERQAARIAVNRTVAGLHYPVDTAVGQLLGAALADLFVARCTALEIHDRGFDGPGFCNPDGTPMDFDLRVSMTDNRSGYYRYGAPTGPIAVSPLLAFMWAQALQEW